MPMTIEIDPKYQRFIEKMVESGRYESAEAVVRVALRGLEAEEAEREEEIEELRALIQEGEDSGDAGEWNKDDFLREAMATRVGSRRTAAE